MKIKLKQHNLNLSIIDDLFLFTIRAESTHTIKSQFIAPTNPINPFPVCQ